jgi:hypothetical protein
MEVGMDDASNPRLRQAILEVVDNQLRDGTPPETRATLDRLLAEGHARPAAIDLIAGVVATEIFHVMKSRRPFDEARFVAALRALPKPPRNDDGKE